MKITISDTICIPKPILFLSLIRENFEKLSIKFADNIDTLKILKQEIILNESDSHTLLTNIHFFINLNYNFSDDEYDGFSITVSPRSQYKEYRIKTSSMGKVQII